MEQARLGGLDLLRGIAALTVVFLHVHVAFPEVATPFTKAYLAVDFFFMLSGFVLARTYHERFLKGLHAHRFVMMRIRRLWPTIAVGAIFGLASQLTAYEPRELAVFFALNMALLPFLAGGVVFPLNGVIWSIFFELVANFVHAKLLARLVPVGLLFIALVMAAVMTMAAMKLASSGAGSWDVGSWHGNFVAGLPRVMLSYTIGCLLYLKFGDRAFRAVPAWVAPVLLPTAIIAGGHFEGWQFDIGFVLVVCPIVLVAGLSSYRWAAGLERVAGDISFPLYAVHMPILLLAAQAGLPWFCGPPLTVAGAALTLKLTGRLSRATWRIGPPKLAVPLQG